VVADSDVHLDGARPSKSFKEFYESGVVIVQLEMGDFGGGVSTIMYTASHRRAIVNGPSKYCSF
jgi:hypothetical protein